MIVIKGGRVIDPPKGIDRVADILILDGKISMIAENIHAEQARIIDARNKIVAPGFIDMHVHLREPGFEYKETIRTGTMSAAVGGFTTVACMPNTQPAIHSKEIVAYIRDKAEAEAIVNVLIIGSITEDIAGKKLTDIGELVKSGIVAISDDGKTPMDMEIMERAFAEARRYGILLIDHCEDHQLTQGGSVNEGNASKRTGLKGIPSVAEWKIVKRDIALAKKYDACLHIAHVSTKESVELIRRAKGKGIKVTCEVAPHHFTLTDEIVTRENTYTKVNPPLRGQADVEAVIQGLRDGTIDMIATDHAPHDEGSKRVDYERAAFGISGLETAFAIAYTELVRKGRLTLHQLIDKMSCKPATILGLDKGTLVVGSVADLVILDLEEEGVIDACRFVSKGKNTPFHGRKVFGKVLYTLVGGKVVVEKGEIVCLSID
ncbi:dihydroorotase [Thermotalea metallivorans]|uniref:Dihydroorotase n=1 Tax=Thermotalea metallivorans TaxID=520762 RepID=A0A140L169_9FIRM|nr:dihydroorotase [Thermotalea metallivorans]KXG74294.1 Dihydroorotase [Thermotalea metallivorans]